MFWSLVRQTYKLRAVIFQLPLHWIWGAYLANRHWKIKYGRCAHISDDLQTYFVARMLGFQIFRKGSYRHLGLSRLGPNVYLVIATRFSFGKILCLDPPHIRPDMEWIWGVPINPDKYGRFEGSRLTRTNMAGLRGRYDFVTGYWLDRPPERIGGIWGADCKYSNVATNHFRRPLIDEPDLCKVYYISVKLEKLY